MFLSRIGKYFYLYYNDQNGIRQKISTRSKSKTLATDFLRSFKIKSLENSSALPSTPLSDFFEEYNKYAKGVLTEKSLRTYKTAFREAMRIWGPVSINSICVRDIEHFISVKCTETSSWAARKHFICLSAAFQKAVVWDLLPENPFKKTKKPKTPEVLPAYLDHIEFKKLIDIVLDIDFKDLIYTALLTGMRLAELRSLKWDNIDFKNKCIVVKNSIHFTTKNKRIRVIPINQHLQTILLDRKKRTELNSEWVFYNSRGEQFSENTVSKVFKKYVKLSNINQNIHFHSLRHSYASALVKEGISLYAIQKLLGHQSIKTTEIYCHLSPVQLHKEVEAGLQSFRIKMENTTDYM